MRKGEERGERRRAPHCSLLSEGVPEKRSAPRYLLLWGHQGEAEALPLGAGGAATAVHKLLHCVGDVVVHHLLNEGDVQPTGSHVRSLRTAPGKTAVEERVKEHDQHGRREGANKVTCSVRESQAPPPTHTHTLSLCPCPLACTVQCTAHKSYMSTRMTLSTVEGSSYPCSVMLDWRLHCLPRPPRPPPLPPTSTSPLPSPSPSP